MIHRVRIWNLLERTSVTLLDPLGQVSLVRFVEDDETLLIHSQSYSLSLQNYTTGEEQRLLTTGGTNILAWCEVDQNHKMILAAIVPPTRSRFLDRWIDVRQIDVGTRREARLESFVMPSTTTTISVAFRLVPPILLAVLEYPRRIVLLSSGVQPEEIDLSRDTRIAAMAFSTDGQTLALRSERSVWFWNVRTRQPTATIAERTEIKATAFSPDGRTFAIGSNDGAVRFYDVATGHQRAAYDWQIGPIHSLAFAPDGMRAAAGSKKGTIVVWDVDG
jgi:WD40 repeat protein